MFDSDTEIMQLDEDLQEAAMAAKPKVRSKTSGVTIKNLRRNPRLAAKADGALASMGLLQDEESSEDEPHFQGQGNSKLLKSGMEVKAS